MPSFKGVTLGVISQWELQKHPEFKHPDSSQYSSSLLDDSPASMTSSKSDRILGRHSTIAVYIPSVPGARFWIRYGIDEIAATASPWYYFKLFMNGRQITSWGVNSITQSRGQVMRALFDPSERWNYRGADGRVTQKGGCEVRPFFFTKEDRERSAAEEGGLIEVMVFRALGRRRMMPRAHEFRSQDQFGIIMPTGGLLDKPQDAKCYDWHLRDPKDRPLATFQFHYRSWDSLVSSQLIPADYPRKLLPVSPSLLSLNGHPRALQSPPIAKDEGQIKICVDEMEQEAESEDSGSSITSVTPWLTTVFDDECDASAKKRANSATIFNLRRTTSVHPLQQHSMDVPVSRFSQGALNSMYRDGDEFESDYTDPVKRPCRPVIPGNRDVEWAGIIARPFPDIPIRNSSLNRGCRRGHSRASSAASNAVSVTPSLRSYFSRDADSPEPALVAVASVVKVIASTFGLDNNPDLKKKDIRSTSRDKLETNALANADSTHPAKRPIGGVFDIANVTLRKHRRSSPSKPISLNKRPTVLEAESGSSPVQESKTSEFYNENNVAASLEATNNNTTVPVSESEWMCRTPSPASIDQDKNVKILSPGGEKHSIRNSLDSVLQKKAGNINARTLKDPEDRDMTAPGAENGGVKIGNENWI